MTVDVLADIPAGNLVGGDRVPGPNGRTIDVENPATGGILTQVADGDVEDMRRALDAAVCAQSSWAVTAPRERAEILRRAFDEVTRRADDFARLITLEMGKPLVEAVGEVRYGADFLRWFSEEAVRTDGRWSTAPDGSSRIVTMKAPVGPTLMITPWNFPLAMATRKIAPAIAAGCTMVLKPSELTPLTSLLLADVLQRAGLPPGVLNVVITSDAPAAAAAILDDPRLRKLTFTGSTVVGQRLIAASSSQVLRVSMELGGNAPVIVLDDADLDRAVQGAMDAKMRNCGQACTAANRILVHESIAAEFTERMVQAMAALRVGDGTDPTSQVGPLIDGRSRHKLARLIGDLADRGAKVLTGGTEQPGPGYFFTPTVLGLEPGGDLGDEELFGPVAPIATFDSDERAIELANSTRYGLASYLFSRDLDRTLNVAERLDFGMIGVNRGVISNAAAPFGGMKHSGYGREGGREGIEEYLETKYVGISAW